MTNQDHIDAVMEQLKNHEWPPEPQGDLATELVMYLFDKVPRWRSIETAPKDARALFFDDGEVFLGEWNDHFQNFHPDDRPVALYDEGEGPTHWMPLPDPPAESGK